MYVKLIDGVIEKAPKVLKDEHNTYSNPMPETLAKFGYKPLVETECPNEEGYTYTVEYVEDSKHVIKNWVAQEMEAETQELGDEFAE